MAIANVIPNGCYVRLLYAVGNQLAINNLGARVLSATVINQALAESLGAAIKSAYNANLAIYAHTTAALVRVGVRDMRVEHQPEFRDTGAPAAGVGTEPALPPQTAFGVTLRTAGAGRSFRGRVYLPGWSELASTTDGTIESTAAVAAMSFMTALQTALSNNGLNLAVLSRPAERFETVKTTFHADGSTTSEVIAKGNARTGTVSNVIAAESRNNLWETQRRRANGRGISPTLLTPVAQAMFAQ